MNPDIKISVLGGVADIDFLLCNKRITIQQESSPDPFIRIFGGTICILNEKRTPIRIGEELRIKGDPDPENPNGPKYSMQILCTALKEEIEFLHIMHEDKYWYCKDRDFLISIISLCAANTF